MTKSSRHAGGMSLREPVSFARRRSSLFRMAVAGAGQLPPMLLELPKGSRHVASVALDGAAALAHFGAAAAGVPVIAARCGAAVHELSGARQYQLVSSVVQLLLDTAQNSNRTLPAWPASRDVICELETAQPSAPFSAADRGAAPASIGTMTITGRARHEPGCWPPAPEAGVPAPRHEMKPRKVSGQLWFDPLQLAHALQAAHASPAPLGLDDPAHIAALSLPRKAGPPRLLRRRPRKRPSGQDLEGAADDPGSGGPALANVGRQPSRMAALRLKPQAAKRPAWAQLTVAEHDEQVQDLLNFVNEL